MSHQGQASPSIAEAASFLEFLRPDDIRIRGHRIGIEDVLLAHLDGLLPEEILLHYPTLSIDEVLAAIRYYELNRDEMNRYLSATIDHEDRERRRQELSPSPAVRRLRELKQHRTASAGGRGVAPGA